MIAERKRRPRRIAADEAHAWARNLRLGNSLAKLVLSMCTLYVDGEGRCFPGIESLSEDTELSIDTVRKRLAWLEQIGAIARFPQWIDEAGRRNGDGRGRRTSDEIRLLMDADPEGIERRANGNGDDTEPSNSDAVSPSPQQGLNSGQESVSPRLAPEQPSTCGKGLDSLNQEPEDSPQPPKGGGQLADQEFEEDLAEAVRSYPPPITDLPKLRNVLSAMKRVERQRVILGMRGYAAFIAECDRKGKKRAVKDAHRWVAAGMWQGYVSSGERAEAVAQQQRIEPESPAGKAWGNLHKIAHLSLLETGGKYLLPRQLSPQAMALANAPPEDDWIFIEPSQANQCGAWNELLNEALAGKNRPPLVWTRNRGGVAGFFAPWPWPPRKDGTVNTGPPVERLSDEDIAAFTESS